jgi:hypothetical protein
LNVLVNNAGISGPTAPVEEMNPDDWKSLNCRANRAFDLLPLRDVAETRRYAGDFLLQSIQRLRIDIAHEHGSAAPAKSASDFASDPGRASGCQDALCHEVLLLIICFE